MNNKIYSQEFTGTTVVEASAGTGKTWTIAALATRWIAEGAAQIDDLLIITFTNNAATELRSRIRGRLIEASRTLAELITGERTLAEVLDKDDFLGFLATGSTSGVSGMLDQDELRARVGRLNVAVQDIDVASISTIHSFCTTVLSSLGVANTIDADRKFIDSLATVRSQITSDVYLRMFMGTAVPPADISQAGRIASAVIQDPFARIRPDNPEEASEKTQANHRFAQAVRDEFELRKKRARLTTHDDLLSDTADLISSEGDDSGTARIARSYLRNRWRYVLVDEFQDTDEIQWKILERAFHGHSTLILIGDPKQAIYAFRGGDLHTYERAVQVAHRTVPLAKNYRSDPRFVESLDELFSFSDKEGKQFNVRVGKIEVGKNEKEPDVILPDTSAPVRIRLLGTDDGSEGQVPVETVRAAVARDVAVDIAHTITAGHEIVVERDPEKGEIRRDVGARDIAVLCHNNDDCERIRAALVDVGINAVVSGGQSVYHSEAVEHWLGFLDAIDQTSNQRLIGAVALSPFFGFTADQLLDDKDEVHDFVVGELRTYAQMLGSQGAAGVFEVLQNDGLMLRRVLGRSNGERLMTDLRHVAEILHQTHPRSGASTLASWLRRERSVANRDEQLRRLESDKSAVSIYTIHSAKGLEFPFVYLPTTASVAAHSAATPQRFHDGQHRSIWVGETRPPEVSKSAKKEAEEEEDRVLYVALTRGVGQVTAYWAPRYRSNATSFHRLLSDVASEAIKNNSTAEEVQRWLRAKLGADIEVEVIKERDVPELKQDTTGPVGDAKTWEPRWVDMLWRRSSYSRLADGASSTTEQPVMEFKEADADDLLAEVTDDVARTQDVDHVPSPMADLPRGRHFGSLVHAVLENVDTRAPDLHHDILACTVEQQRYWPVDVDEEGLARSLEAVLTTPLRPAFEESIADLDPAHVLNELDFEIPVGGGASATEGSHHDLKDLAPILRDHLDEDDPLYAYARDLESEGLGAQTLRGYLNGSIDLVFRRGEKFYVADYKTNWIGGVDDPLTTATYDAAHVREAMEGSSYPLQALLYTVALHRYLSWRLPGYKPDTHIGGVLYLYVRGMAGPHSPVVDGHSTGVFFWQPPGRLIVELSEALDGKVRT